MLCSQRLSCKSFHRPIRQLQNADLLLSMNQRCFCTPTSHEATRVQEISSLKCAKSDTFEILRYFEGSNFWLVFRTSYNCQLTANSIFHLLEQFPPGSCALLFHRHRKRITDKVRDSKKTFAIDTNPGIRLHDLKKN